MAPDIGAPKRKRGRPSNASRRANASREGDDADDSEFAPAKNHRKTRKRDNARKSTTKPNRKSGGVARRSTGSKGAANLDELRRKDNASKLSTTIGKRGIPQPLSGPRVPNKRQPRETTRQRLSNENNGSEDTDAHDDDDLPPSPEKPYTHVAPHVRRVRQATIEAKWSPLERPSITALTSILQLAHRPILQRLSNTQQRRTHTAAALRLVSNRIMKKIARGLPFPPSTMLPPRGRGSGARGRPRNLPDGGRESELNFESVLNAKQALEKQLDPALHAVDLLKSEKRRMERELELDYDTLRSLEAGARAQARENRSLFKKAHVLIPDANKSQTDSTVKSDVSFQQDDVVSNPFENIAEEDALGPLIAQLGDHVDHMRRNLQQAEGILPQLESTKSAVQSLLSRYLNEPQYEQILLGP